MKIDIKKADEIYENFKKIWNDFAEENRYEREVTRKIISRLDKTIKKMSIELKKIQELLLIVDKKNDLLITKTHNYDNLENDLFDISKRKDKQEQ